MTSDPTPEVREAYLDLLKRSVLGITVGPATFYRPLEKGAGPLRTWVARALRKRGRAVLAETFVFDPAQNREGEASVWDLPAMYPLTMIGSARLDNVEACLRDVIESNVLGDVIETGVWRGGTTIFMRGFLRAYGVTDRRVYVADSFEGLPAPDIEKYPADEGLYLHLWPGLAVSLEEVKANFARFGLLDEQVEFVQGWFRDTLPSLQGRQWSVIRLDGDLYESTIDALENLYPGLASGGWLLVDDYEIDACRQAVTDYRERNGISEPIIEVDWTGICWQKRSTAR
jgi:O-methyltransferase